MTTGRRRPRRKLLLPVMLVLISLLFLVYWTVWVKVMMHTTQSNNTQNNNNNVEPPRKIRDDPKKRPPIDSTKRPNNPEQRRNHLEKAATKTSLHHSHPPTKGQKKLTKEHTTIEDKKEDAPVKNKEEEMLIKCSPWEINMDDWWQDHPDWEPSLENDTHTCFRPIATSNPQRAEFYRQVHARQFPTDLEKGCSTKKRDHHKLFVAKVYDYGFAATILHLLTEGIWSAFLQDRPMQYGHIKPDFKWLYVPEDKNSWAYCPSQDFTCFFLPLSSCPRPPVEAKEDTPKRIHLWGDTEKNQTLWLQNIWMSHYVARPRQELRKHFYQFWKEQQQTIQSPCTWIHVRRGDAMTEKGYDRNFYSIQEYLTRGNIPKGERVLLLTDDQSAIDEATLLHPEYQWTFWNRTRNFGPTAFNSQFFPSGDKIREVMIILAETRLASQFCRKGVYGKSNMARWIRNEAVVEHGPENISYLEIDQKLKKTRVDADVFMKDLNTKIATARKMKQEHQEANA